MHDFILELQREFDSTTYPIKTYQYFEAEYETESPARRGSGGSPSSATTLRPHYANADQRTVDEARYVMLL
jgi:hypothetical protein